MANNMANNMPETPANDARVTILRERVRIWKMSGLVDDHLGTESRDDLLRELREWIVRRLRNNASIVTEQSFTLRQKTAIFNALQPIMEVMINVGVPDREGLLRVRARHNELRNATAVADALNAEQARLADEAAFLTRTARVRHGVNWPAPYEQRLPALALDIDVVSAISRLDQPNVSLARAVVLLAEQRRQKDELQARIIRQEGWLAAAIVHAMGLAARYSGMVLVG